MAHCDDCIDITLADSKQPLTQWDHRRARFFLSSMPSITLFAQYRSTTFRSSEILSVTQIPNNIGRAWIATKYQYGLARRGKGNESLGGEIIDLKFLVCIVHLGCSLDGHCSMVVHSCQQNTSKKPPTFALVCTGTDACALLGWGFVAFYQYVCSLDG
ncbi:hypothetical protein V7S43_012933 [Phytophthora oleae]|uniref:PiggyBac transposable element-derived protein domain-containing protein n=1 Tax=Phytophthora oleae TaxID=2107226 RepID=A0ABD3F5M0_9STRA